MAISQPHHPATQTDGDASGEANGTSLVAAPSPKVGARGRRSVRIRSAGRATSSAHRTRYGWINLSVPDAELDAFTDRFATRVASFDRLAIKTAKEILNTRSHVASGTDQQSTNARFLDAFARPHPSTRRWPTPVSKP
jgi:1,4-dihydroxy-2-naphthoyl-CoA synthase